MHGKYRRLVVTKSLYYREVRREIEKTWSSYWIDNGDLCRTHNKLRGSELGKPHNSSEWTCLWLNDYLGIKPN